MALLPSIVFIIGGSLLAALSDRRARLVQIASAGLAVFVGVLLYLQLPDSFELSIWRPTDLFGSGFEFSANDSIWPFLLLCCGVVLFDALLGSLGAMGLFHAAAAVAATVAGNLLTAITLWTIMALVEGSARLKRDGVDGLALRKLAVQGISVVLLIAAAYGGESASLLFAFALIVRAGGGLNSASSLGLATFPALAALSLASQSSIDVAHLAWAWVAIVVLLSIQSLFFDTRPSGFAIALAVAGLASTQQAIWIAVSGLLVLCIGVLRIAGSRFVWLPVLLFPLAFSSGETTTLAIWMTGFLLTAMLTILARLLTGRGFEKPLSRLQIGSLSALVATTAVALVTSSLSPSVVSLLIAAVGLAAGYGVTLLSPRTSGIQEPMEAGANYLLKISRAILGAIGAAIRTAVNVLEGESAVLWILLVLLLAVIGLQALAT